MSNPFDKFDVAPTASKNPFDQFDQAKPADTDGPLARGWKSVKSSVGLTADLASRDTAAASERIRAQAEYQKANPGSEEGQGLMKAWREGDGIIGGIKGVAGEVANDYNNAKGFGAGAMSVGRNLQAMGSGIVEQVPNMILPMAGMLAGGAAGSSVGLVGTAVGGFAGAAAGNSVVGTSEAAFRQLEKAGINPADTAAVKSYLDKNGDSILGETAVKGAVIGAVDTATMGLSHALLSGPGRAAANKALAALGVDVADKAAVSAASKTPAFKSLVANDAAYQASQTGAQKVARNAAAGLAEPAGEFTGEYAGSYAATGEADAKDAFLEAASSLGQSGLTFAGQKLYQGMTSPGAGFGMAGRNRGEQAGQDAPTPPATGPNAVDPTTGAQQTGETPPPVIPTAATSTGEAQVAGPLRATYVDASKDWVAGGKVGDVIRVGDQFQYAPEGSPEMAQWRERTKVNVAEGNPQTLISQSAPPKPSEPLSSIDQYDSDIKNYLASMPAGPLTNAASVAANGGAASSMQAASQATTQQEQAAQVQQQADDKRKSSGWTMNEYPVGDEPMVASLDSKDAPLFMTQAGETFNVRDAEWNVIATGNSFEEAAGRAKVQQASGGKAVQPTTGATDGATPTQAQQTTAQRPEAQPAAVTPTPDVRARNLATLKAKMLAGRKHQAAPAISQPGQAPQAVGAQPASPAAGVPTTRNASVEAVGLSDQLEDALFKERDATTSAIENDWMNGNGRRRQTNIERAVHDAVTASTLDADSAAQIIETALENDRPDLAQYAASRAMRAAESMGTTPGVPQSSPKYGKIKSDLEASKKQALDAASALQEIVNSKQAPQAVGGQSESAQSLTDAPSRLRRIEALNTERSAIARQLEAQGLSIGDDPLGRAIQAATSPLATRDADWLLEALTYSEQTNRTDIAQEVKLRLTELADKLEAESVTDSVTPGVATDNPKYATIAANLQARRDGKSEQAAAIRTRLQGQPTQTVSEKGSAVIPLVEIPPSARYELTQAPVGDIAPLSREDADFELEVLEARAVKGKLTPEVFATSEVGRRLGTATLSAIQTTIATNPVGTIQSLRAQVNVLAHAAAPTVKQKMTTDAPAAPVSKQGKNVKAKAAQAVDAVASDVPPQTADGELPQPLAKKAAYSALLPYNIQGNKTQLLANGLDAFLRNAAKGARRVIDAFGGAAAYTHALAHNGDLPKGSIYNEFEPLRYITNKQIKENVEQVIARLEFHVGKIKEILATSEEQVVKRKRTAEYVINGINSHKQDGVPEHAKGLDSPPSNMADSPDLAALYLIAQNSRFGYRPIQSDVGEDGKLRVMADSENDLVSITKGGEKVTLFGRGKDKLIDSADNLRAASKRLQGVDVRMGDGWMIGAKDAAAGDVLLVDTSYLNKTDEDTGKTTQTANYNKATQEDAVPAVYKEKVTENLLPAWDRGAKIVITNNWDDDVVAYLKKLGFTVIQDQRAKGVSNDTRELIAINFDQRTGAVNSRRGTVSGGVTGRTGKPANVGGNDPSGQDGVQQLAAGTASQDGAVSGPGRETDAGIKASRRTSTPTTPASTIRQAITKAYGNLLTRLEVKGLVTLTQTEEEAIEAAAQARVDANGGDVEAIKAQMRASVLASQRAWHGTPHRGIEKFSTDKIGTGEGAQAYGWGLYFADRREIADHYRNALSQVGYDTPSGRALTRKYLSDEYGYSARASNFIISALDDNNGDVSQAIKDLTGERSLDGRVGSIRYRELDQAIGLLVNFAGRQLKKSKGQLYEVDIPEDSDMLLWDKPLSQQSEAVRDAAMKAARKLYPRKDQYDDADLGRIKGEVLYQGLASYRFGGPKVASQYLASLGIKGIKYLDGTSRNAGEGSYNYVVFSGDDVQIVDVKYSKDGTPEGFFDPATGKSFLIADNLTAESAPATLMHEVGIHMAAEGKFGPMFDRALTVLNDGSLESTEALRRMQESGETSGEEAAAYLVTVYETNRTNAPASVKQWMKDMIAAVRAWLFSKGVIISASQLTVADISAVARANANRMARGDGRTGDGAVRNSKQPTPDVVSPMFSRTRPVFSRAAQGQASTVVQGIVDTITSRWANAPKVVVAFDMSDPAIPERVRQEDQRQRSGFKSNAAADLLVGGAVSGQEQAKVAFVNTYQPRNLSSLQTTLDEIRDLLEIPVNPGVLGPASNAVDGNASPVKGGIQGSGLDAKRVGRILDALTAREKVNGGINVEAQRLVFADVFELLQDDKILDSVIKSVPVEVMNLLTGGKLSPKALLHDKAMLRNSLTVNGEVTVASQKVADTLVLATALSGAVVVRANNAPVLPLKTNSASSADQIYKSHTTSGDNGNGRGLSREIGTPRGFYYKGVVYLLSSQLKSPKDVVETLLHESLGHFGLRGVFGKELKPLLQQIATMRKSQVEAKMKEYGLRGVSNIDRLVAAEEVLAEMAQDSPQIGFVRRAIATIKAWLRKNIPGFMGMNMSDDEIITSFIMPARNYVVNGGPNGGSGGGVRFQRGTTEPMPENKAPGPQGDAQQGASTGNAVAVSRQIAQAIQDDDDPYADYGLRVIPPEADVVVQPGDELPPSNQWDDGTDTGEALDGTSSARIDGDTEGAALKAIRLIGAHGKPGPNGYYYGDQVVLIKGKKSGVGEDVGEILLNDAVVVATWRKPDKGNSEVAPNEQSTPTSQGVRFSRTMGEALNAGVNNVKAFDVTGATSDQLAHYRGMGMQVLGRRQIVDLYGDMLPELKAYDSLVQKMDADKNESGAEADALVSDWAKLDERSALGFGAAKNPGMERKLAELMHDATLAQIDPDKPIQKGDDSAQHAVLAGRFNALSPKAQEVYRTARDMYADHFKKVQEALQERIQRSGMDETSKAKMIAKMDADLFNKLKGVYFPLARFGKYVVVSKNEAGETVSVSRAETLAEANKMRREVVKNSPQGVTVSRVYKDAEFNASRDAVGKGFVSDLMTMLQGQGVGEDVLDSVGQLYLSSLPDLSWAKHGIHRKGTPGFSQDARRAFAQNMFHGARHLAKLRYSDQLADKLMDMEQRVKDQRDDEGFDPVKAQQVVDEMNARHETLMNPKTSSLSTALTSVGFVWFLGISPASAMVNLSQTALVAYPVMAAKWGFQKAGTALLAASSEVVRAGNDLSKVLKGEELAAFQKAVDDGTIDVTQAHDLAGVAQGEDERVAMAMRPVMRAASFMFHHAEKFNRQATFIAAYRLAKENGVDADKAFEQAKKATYDGHFDYSAGNRPRIMQGNWQKVLFLFKQYGQNMVYTLTRQAYLSMKGMTPEQRTEARKQLGGLLAMHAMAAGALGLPLVGVLLSAASMVGGDDDEPWDAEVALKNMMADAMGPKAAEVMAHGLSRLTPWDLSGRVALNKLILPDIQEGLEGQPLWEKMVTAAAGPVAGIGGGFVKGMAEMGQGQYQRGLESMLPVALKNTVKALRFGEEGAVDKTGVVIKDEVGAAGVIGQAMGFRPSDVALATEGKTAIYQADKALTERRSNLVRLYAMSRMNGDSEGTQDALDQVRQFNEKNPNRRITMPNLMQSVRNRQRRIDDAEQGVYLPKNRRDALEAGRFALVE